jgi:serine/threonine-protein phosphatase 2A regulatory subunit A
LFVIITSSSHDGNLSCLIFYLIAKKDELDQVLVAMADKLSKFLPLIGGPDHAHTLISLFEVLCEAEEITVREATVSSVCVILKQLGPSHKPAILSYFDLFKRLSNEEAGELFYARVSCCHLVPELYKLLNDSDRVVVRDIYARLCKDELPIVRRAAALQFLKLSQYLDADALVGDFFSLFNTLVNDESQTVQIIALEILAPYAALLKTFNHNALLTSDVLSTIKTFTDSQSWKMRQSLAKKFGMFAKIFTVQEVTSDIFPCLINLVQDPEPEVRSIAILEVLPFLDTLGTTPFITEFAPVAQQLIHDPIANVRRILADLSVDVVAKLDAAAVSQYLSDLIMKLMEDDDPQVRLGVIKKLPIIAEEAPSLCTRMTEILKVMFNNNFWRIRMELVSTMPLIVKHMGQDYYNDHFFQLTLNLLKDPVESVRTTTASVVPLIAAVSDLNWSYESLFPPIKLMSSADFTIRISMISALEGFLRIENLSDKFHSEVINLLISTASDKVPNIRIRAAQGINIALSLSYIGRTYGDTLQYARNDLLKDKDKDVKYFAAKGVHE